MSESPIFTKTYDLLQWLIPKTTKFAREYRFSLALPIQEHAFAVQRHLVQAAKVQHKEDIIYFLNQADVELTMLRYKIRLSRDLNLLTGKGYEQASRLMDEVGRLLGGWMKKNGMKNWAWFKKAKMSFTNFTLSMSF
jgi:four helix bundle protein